MTKKQNCKICGNYSGKSDTCKECKTNFPYKSSGSDGRPFNRLNEFMRIQR